jgi:small subunit ribosomal protein S20
LPVRRIINPGQQEEAGAMLQKLNSMLDKLAKKNIIHKKKASNLKSSVQKHVSSLK